MILADVDVTSWAAIITAIGAFFIGILGLLLNFFMQLRAQDKADAKEKADALAAAVNRERLESIANTGEKTLKETNHNYQQMQKEVTASREEIAKVHKRFAEFVESMKSEMSGGGEDKPKSKTSESGRTEIEVEKLDLVLQSRPSDDEPEEKPEEKPKPETDP